MQGWFSAVCESKVDADGADLATAEPVHEVARKRVLARRADDTFALVAGFERGRIEGPHGAVRVVDDGTAGLGEITRPTDVPIWMADVVRALRMEHADQPSPRATVAAARDFELNNIADAAVAPHPADERVDQRENAVLETEG